MPYSQRVRTDREILDLHRGSKNEWLTAWHQRVATTLTNAPDRANLIGTLIDMISDTQNLFVALQHQQAYGGSAPGPDGRRYVDFGSRNSGQVLRVLSAGIRQGIYRSATPRLVKQSKGPGRGDRWLALFNVFDRVVHRGILQIIQPLIDPTFISTSFGGRPGLSVYSALAHLEQLVLTSCKSWGVADDLRNAFDRVPRERLRNVLSVRIPNPAVIELIRACWGDSSAFQGVPQGSPLSMLLLNLYLDHNLDRAWASRHPQVDLLRYVDDLLLVGRTEVEVSGCRQQLRSQVASSGMPVKPSDSTPVDLSNGGEIEWLGFRLSMNGGKLCYRLPDEWQSSLRESLLACHAKPHSVRSANASISGWISGAGPVWCTADIGAIYDEVQRIARELGFAELLGFTTFLAECRQAVKEWRHFRRYATRDAGGQSKLASASDSSHRRPGQPPQLECGSYRLVTDGCCLGRPGIGGAAYQLHRSDRGRGATKCGGLRRTTNNRAELIAVIHGVERVADNSRVTLVTDSRYVERAINGGIRRWKANSWRSRRGRPIKNRDLLERLSASLSRLTVRVTWVRGHNGDRMNERMDRMANHAAVQLSRIMQRRALTLESTTNQATTTSS